MAQQQSVSMPGVFGGLMRYDTEYRSKISFPPSFIIGLGILVILFIIVLNIFFPAGG